MSKQDFIAQIEDLRKNFGNVLRSGLDCSSDHLERFGKRMNVREFEKFAVDNKITDLDLAYERFIAPKVKEQQEKEWEEKLAKARELAREEGKAEGLKMSIRGTGLPVDTAPTSPFFDRLSGKDIDGNSRSELINDMLETYIGAGKAT